MEETIGYDVNILTLQIFVLQQLWQWCPNGRILLSLIPFNWMEFFCKGELSLLCIFTFLVMYCSHYGFTDIYLMGCNSMQLLFILLSKLSWLWHFGLCFVALHLVHSLLCFEYLPTLGFQTIPQDLPIFSWPGLISSPKSPGNNIYLWSLHLVNTPRCI